jgi:hypothetical protein
VCVCVCVYARARLLQVWSENKFTLPVFLVHYCHLQLEQLTFNCTAVPPLLFAVVSQLPDRSNCVAANTSLHTPDTPSPTSYPGVVVGGRSSVVERL